MGFSWYCYDKDGKDLFGEFGVHRQALGLGANSPEDTDSYFRVNDIRATRDEIPLKDFPAGAQLALATVQRMVAANIDALRPRHCPTCRCQPAVPDGWSVAACKKLLRIPLKRASRAEGGF